MYCKDCGKIVDDDSKFCRYCGLNQKTGIPEDVNKSVETNYKDNSKSIGINGKILKNISFYDNDYIKEYNAANFGGVLLVVNLIIQFFALESNYFNAETYNIYLFINVCWRIIATFWCVNIAKRQNRSDLAWGIIAFIIPNLALIILGLSRKLSLNDYILFKYKNVEYKILKKDNLFSFGYGNYEEFIFMDLDNNSHKVYRKKSSQKFFVTYPDPILFNSLDDYFSYLKL